MKKEMEYQGLLYAFLLGEKRTADHLIIFTNTDICLNLHFRKRKFQGGAHNGSSSKLFCT